MGTAELLQPVLPEVADDVVAGLCSYPKALPPWFFYDARGSSLFEEIARLPEYYLTRTEHEILETHAFAILDQATFAERERIHTENSYKYTHATVRSLLGTADLNWNIPGRTGGNGSTYISRASPLERRS